MLLQVVALITIEVHARDVIDKLGKAAITSPAAFEWSSQLRFYWDQDSNDCVVKQVCGILIANPVMTLVMMEMEAA